MFLHERLSPAYELLLAHRDLPAALLPDDLGFGRLARLVARVGERYGAQAAAWVAGVADDLGYGDWWSRIAAGRRGQMVMPLVNRQFNSSRAIQAARPQTGTDGRRAGSGASLRRLRKMNPIGAKSEVAMPAVKIRIVSPGVRVMCESPNQAIVVSALRGMVASQGQSASARAAVRSVPQ